MAKKSNRRLKGLNVYANLTAHRKSRADSKARRRAEYLASLPKQPVKRLLYRLHPKRVFKFWFSKQGGMTLLKLAGVGVIIMGIFIAALFAYYRKELDALNPSELAKRVQTTVTKYEDRNGVLLWEDRGLEDYTLVVDNKKLPKSLKEATIAVEDKEFYKHGGISLTGILRASINNLTGGDVQGASTLTQQLIRQVFLANDFAQNRLSISRKIKEIILAIEVERMYTKEQILSLYLNVAPYGGRRNGAEAAALTYFGKHAQDLKLAESALIAGIPKDPTYLNPYNVDGNKDLIQRQHLVLDDMVGQGFITKAQAEKAKKYPILDTLKDEFRENENIKAPHFVKSVQKQLEEEFGTQVIRGGGLRVKTTLDWRIEQKAEQEIKENYHLATSNGADNMALSAVDVPTGQVLAMVGSYDVNNKKFGSVNAAESLLQPGSSIKPFMYANLFKPKQGQNFGAGSILADENIDRFYGGQLRNYDGGFFGSISIRQALGNSRNPPAVKAAYIGGIDNAVQTARDAGDKSYCVGIDYGLSAAIGSCSVKNVEHTNAFATLGREGVYKPLSYVLEVKNAQGQVLKQWKDDQSKKVLDPQITYMLSDILTDANARSRVFGPAPPGMSIPGVKTATKTGTTDDGNGRVKDAWMMSYTPRMAVGAWTGRSDGKPLFGLSSASNAAVVGDVQRFAHVDVFQKDGSWKPDAWFNRPSGIQNISVNGRSDIFPSWYSKPKSTGQKMTFDSISKKKATNCTPDRAKVELDVQSAEDPVTKQKTIIAPDGYNARESDDVHKCSDNKPFASISVSNGGNRINVTVKKTTHPLDSLEISVNGDTISEQSVSGNGTYGVNHSLDDGDRISVTVIDNALYSYTASVTYSDDEASLPPWWRRRWDS